MQRLIAPFFAFVAIDFGGSPGTFAADGPKREINLTADSAPGWQPSPEVEQSARSRALAYLGDMDSGRYAEAYAYLDQLNRQESLDEFAARLKKFNTLAGRVKGRDIIKITWTKDPKLAPKPGVYAAIDLVSRFTNIDRHCGFVILYQSPAGGDFYVMRSEDNFLDNATANSIAKQKSASGVDEAWAQVSANCPNYHNAAAAPEPLPETEGSPTGYPTVAAALSDLRLKRGVVISQQNGWIVANDSAAMTIWTFAPPNHPAYPTAVKRQIENRGGAAYVDMSVQCEASKAACDDLVRSFEALNEQMAQSLKGH